MSKSAAQSSNASKKISTSSNANLPPNNKKEIKIDEHQQDIKKVISKYNTNLKTGLTSCQAQKLLKENGLNQLTPPKKTPEWRKFVTQLVGGFSLLLWFVILTY